MSLDELFSVLSYPFMIRAIIVGVLVSFCASLLGVILVLKRYSLIGHGLSDVGFAALALALAIGASPIYFATPIVIAASFIIMYVSQNKRINGDVAIGIFSTGALSFGIIITAISKGFNMDIYSYMFGSVLAMSSFDVVVSVILSIVVIATFVIFYNRLFIVTADEEFARAIGINVTFYQFLISFLTALTVVIGMRMIGTLLISSLIIFPAIIARRFVRSFKYLVALSALISVFCFIWGILISFFFNLPTGAGIVLVNIILLALSSFFSTIFSRINYRPA